MGEKLDRQALIKKVAELGKELSADGLEGLEDDSTSVLENLQDYLKREVNKPSEAEKRQILENRE